MGVSLKEVISMEIIKKLVDNTKKIPVHQTLL